jgi:peptidoglycan/xylan/chitin deacetylase (PgdA/CDA1 family)
MSMDRIVTTSWDDGGRQDLRLAELLSEFGMPGTFYVSPRNRERRPLSQAELRELDAGFEIGGHSLNHADLPALGPEDLASELVDCRHGLEDALGHGVTAFSYPFGHYDDRVRRAVAEAGFTTARTTRMLRTAPAHDPLLAPTSLQAHPAGRGFWLLHCVRTAHPAGLPTVLMLPRGAGWVELGIRLFERVRDRGGVWHLWGHSWEVDELDLWDELRRLLAAVSGHADVSYLPNSAAILRDRAPQDTSR